MVLKRNVKTPIGSARGTGEGHRTRYVRERLCDALIRGQFHPGEKLKLRDVAERYETSLTPAREALQQLVAKQILVAQPNSTIVVPNPTLAEFQETTRIRCELEGLAAEQATLRMDKAQLDAIVERQKRYEHAGESGNWRRSVGANADFHMALYEAAEMPSLLEFIEVLWLRNGPIIGWHFKTLDNLSWGDDAMHGEIIKGLRARNKRVVRQAVRRDIVTAAKPIEQRLSAQS